ncbi:MAG: hypothetical protein COY66_04000, partial [Candidatus Kerfeldbacteria bacterium CG_4_10_14_0_8_um_filter_42_10]
AASDWGGDCAANGTITLLPGENKVCTITNNDIAPELTVIKHVITDNGGTALAADFTMNVTGTNVSDPSFPGDENGITVTLDQGSYSVDEGLFFGYEKTLSPDCSGTINVGEEKTCTITNDDEAPTITLIKNVVNDNGGNASVNDFGLTIGGISVNSGDTLNVDANTPIALDEAGLFGYNFVAITGDEQCPQVLGGTVALNEGEGITCTITNDDIQPTLTLVKTVINDNGGILGVSDFPLYIDNQLVISGIANPVSANHQYTATEDIDTGYAASVWGGDCAALGTITLQPGENKVCTVTNDDVAPTITLVKAVNNNHAGTAVPSDFTLTLDGVGVTQGAANAVAANIPHTINEVMVDGYQFVSLTGDEQCPSVLNDTATLLPGENITCTVTNEDIAPPVLDINKSVSPVTVLAGGNLTYTIEWQISGEADATNVTITDPIPLNTTFVSASNEGVYSTADNTVTWALGTKAPGDSGIFTVNVTVNSLAEAGTIIVNTATIDSSETDPVSDDASSTVMATTAPILQITKDVSDPSVNPGATVTYTVVITNVGSADALNVTLTDVMPTNLTFVSGGGNTKTFELGDLAIGDSVTKTYNVLVADDSGAGTYTNTATAEADNHSPISAQADLGVVLPTVLGDETSPDLAIVKTVNVAFANPGNTVEYTVKITNNGDGDATNVTLTDQLPSGFTFDGTTDAVKAWELGDLAPNEEKTVTYKVKIADNMTAGTYNNLAIANADNNDDVTAQAPLEVRAIAVLGASLEETGTGWMDYLVYIVGIGLLAFGIGLFLKKESHVKAK